MSSASAEKHEWLEADGLGGFASGTAAGTRTRRYHALLLAATRPPSGRMVLVSGLEAWVDTPHGSFALTTERYAPDVLHPDGAERIESFTADPWPRWTWSLPCGGRIVHELFVVKDEPATVLTWTASGVTGPVTLRVRPLFAGRDYHALQRENGAFRFDPIADGETLLFRPYDGVPGTRVVSTGRYRHDPLWYRNFLYAEERARGLDDGEDLAAPGEWSFDLGEGEASLLLAADVDGHSLLGPAVAADLLAARLRERERVRRAALGPGLARAADAYIVRKGAGRTIIAGYPWFTDWGRDTFIALRGLSIDNGRLDVARDVLLQWAGAVSEGMLPNRFPDGDEAPEYNSVDASLWFVIVAYEYLRARAVAGLPEERAERDRLLAAVREILRGYARGTRYGIRADEDGLLLAGEPGVQLTWMDAKIGDWVVTPRTGKPVEIEALWLNALLAARALDPLFEELLARGLPAFRERFWDETRGCLYDVVDVDGVPGVVDASFRPNQVLAMGGLPFPLLDLERGRRMVREVEQRLWTPLGLRSLDPHEAAYRGRYAGGVLERDGAYHQGTVWPWLAGAFLEAWVRVHGDDPAARAAARRRFLGGLHAHLRVAGLGHVSEIADGDAPHAPGGCPFQAWSVSELLRIEKALLVEDDRPRTAAGRVRPAGRPGLQAQAG